MAQLAANYLAAHNVELTAQFLCVMRAPDPVIRCLYSVMSETRDDHYDICVLCGGETSAGRFREDRRRLHLLITHLNMDEDLMLDMFNEVGFTGLADSLSDLIRCRAFIRPPPSSYQFQMDPMQELPATPVERWSPPLFSAEDSNTPWSTICPNWCRLLVHRGAFPSPAGK